MGNKLLFREMDIFYFLSQDCLISESLEHKLASLKCYLIFAFHLFNLNNNLYFTYSADRQNKLCHHNVLLQNQSFLSDGCLLDESFAVGRNTLHIYFMPPFKC